MGASNFTSSLFSGAAGDAVEKVGDAIQKNVATEQERAALENEARKAEQEFGLRLAQLDTDVAKAQIDLNKEEARNPHLFVAGWRPFIGWLSGIVLGIMYIPKCVVLTVFWACQAYYAMRGGSGPAPQLPAFPNLGSNEIIGLLGAMLGLGGMRTWEKVKGVESTGIRVFNR